MAERIFLEEVGSPYSVNALGSAKAWKIDHLRNDPTIPPLIYVVESKVGKQLLLGREISGRPKFNMIRSLAKPFIELFLEQLKEKNCSQYLILRDAYPLDLQYAIGGTSPYDLLLLPTGFVKLQRTLNPEGTDWEIQGQNLIGAYQGDTWLIPDTVIASGSTISSFLQNDFDQHLPKQVYILTAFGSLEGIQRIYQECLNKDVDLIPVFSECIFEVSRVGNLPGRPLSDLSVMSPGSIMTKELYEKASHRYQETRMCCVGDIGESLENPPQHSMQTLLEMQILEMNPKEENWDAWTVNVREESFKKKVFDFNPALFEYFKVIWKDEH
jgi:hypothetical protein